MLVTIVASIACFIVGGILSYVLFKYGLKAKYDNVLKEAETEAEVIKKNKLLEVKEKFLNKKADLEKEVALRNQKIQQAENKLKQREMVLSQRQEEIQRKRAEADAVRENLEAQLGIVDKKKEELDKLQHQEIEKLEALSGLSAEEAKERLVESLKEEAKTQAQSYINDIILRYADVLLSKAEAIIETNGNVADAIAILNRIRTERDDVKISLLPTSMSREEAREKVRHERRIELALEGRYWSDVKRWKIGKELYPMIIKDHEGSVIETKFPNGYLEYYDLLPIPDSERSLNPNLDQNPGW
mgnify:CR=1 FL=1